MPDASTKQIILVIFVAPTIKSVVDFDVQCVWETEQLKDNTREEDIAIFMGSVFIRIKIHIYLRIQRETVFFHISLTFPTVQNAAKGGNHKNGLCLTTSKPKTVTKQDKH